MARRHEDRQPTGREFVDAAATFADVTVQRCLALPQRWWEPLAKPLVESALSVEELAAKANAVWVSSQLPPGELARALAERDVMLAEALRELSAFDLRFNRLLRHVDLERSEAERIAAVIARVAAQGGGEVEVVRHPDRYDYVSKGGVQCVRLRLTEPNKRHWLRCEDNAKGHISKRLSADRRKIRAISGGTAAWCGDAG